MALINDEKRFEELMHGLNRRGARERALLNALKRRQKLLAENMSDRAPEMVPDVLQQTDRCVQSRELHDKLWHDNVLVVLLSSHPSAALQQESAEGCLGVLFPGSDPSCAVANLHCASCIALMPWRCFSSL